MNLSGKREGGQLIGRATVSPLLPSNIKNHTVTKFLIESLQ